MQTTEFAHHYKETVELTLLHALRTCMHPPLYRCSTARAGLTDYLRSDTRPHDWYKRLESAATRHSGCSGRRVNFAGNLHWHGLITTFDHGSSCEFDHGTPL